MRARLGAITLLALSMLVLPVLVLPVSAQHEDRSENKPKNPAIGDPTAIAAGQKLFASSCAGCHGPTGEGGRGPNLRERGAWHPLDDDGMFRIIQKGAAGADMPPLKAPDEQIWQLVAYVRALTSPAFEVGVLGDANAGKSIFWGKGGCGNCHTVNGKGGSAGPDLSNIGAVRPVSSLRESILLPSEKGVFEYQPAVVTLRNGGKIEGVARNRTNYALQLIDRSGKVHLLEASQIESIALSKTSLMPAGYGQKLAKDELQNVLAYLGQLSVRPKSAAKETSK